MSQLTSKTQALVDAQVAVFRGEMVAMQADISKCMDCMEKDENHMAEVDSRLSSSASKLAELLTWRTGRTEMTFVCTESLKTQRQCMLLLSCQMLYHCGFLTWAL